MKVCAVNLSRFSTLQWALGGSVAAHALLLSLRFIDPEGFNRVFQDTALEVILVNAKSAQRPEKAQAIAQYSLAGGGEAERGRATSPLPPSLLTDVGDTTQDAQRKIELLRDQQSMLLAQIRAQLASMAPTDLAQSSKNAQAQEQEDRRRQMVKLLAQIERRVNDENARPKKRYVSAATQGAVYAIYYDSLRQRIESKGTENFPTAAGNKLYGDLTMVITVNHDGRVLATEVVQSSGNRLLDRRAQSIAQSAGPFGVFSPAMRREFDQFVMVARFRFTREETLETRISSP
ncbi:MAG: TonB family protein [Betaproteobacteria bacterium]